MGVTSPMMVPFCGVLDQHGTGIEQVEALALGVQL
jgi:hypothetical protein